VEATLLLYVPPHALAAVLADAAQALGAERRCVVARELTKVHVIASHVLHSAAASCSWSLVSQGPGFAAACHAPRCCTYQQNFTPPCSAD